MLGLHMPGLLVFERLSEAFELVGVPGQLGIWGESLLVFAHGGRRTVGPDGPVDKREDMKPFGVNELLEVREGQRSFAPRYADITAVLGLTGLRFGELRGLKVEDVLDIPYPAFRVRRSVPASRGGGKPIVRDRTKTGKDRTIPLADLLIPIVRTWAEGTGPGECVFTAPGGGWINLSNWRRSVRWSQTSRGRRPYELRHTAATAWLAAGIDVMTVQT
jgi:integrase